MFAFEPLAGLGYWRAPAQASALSTQPSAFISSLLYMGCSRWEVLRDGFLVHSLSLNANNSGDYLMKGGHIGRP